MLKIKNRKIYLTRGDTAYIELKLRAKRDGEELEFQEGDKIYFSVKEDVGAEDYLFQRVVNPGEVIVIEPSDTKQLDYGIYLYDIQVSTAMGEVFTVVEPTAFFLTEEITYE